MLPDGYKRVVRGLATGSKMRPVKKMAKLHKKFVKEAKKRYKAKHGHLPEEELLEDMWTKSSVYKALISQMDEKPEESDEEMPIDG